MSSLWERKILALLHDPIEKARKIQGHEKIFEERARILNLDPKDLKRSADHLSSAADRILFPFEKNGENDGDSNKIISDFYKEGEFIHPLSGQKLNNKDYLLAKEDVKLLESSELNKKFEKLTRGINKNDNEYWKKLYHKLWWELPKLYKFSYMLPADTRIPDHSIIDHLDTAAALTIDGSKSLLMVSIGPVQEFIAAARKTRDMKSGSYMLSYLIFQGIKVIGNRYGYDSIVFPNMRGQYFLKKEFESKGIVVSFDEKFDIPPSIASLPNVFTAIVPTNDINELKNLIRLSIHKEIEQISDFVKKSIKVSLKKLKQDLQELEEIETNDKTIARGIKDIKLINENIWDKQMEQFPNIIFSSYDFKNTDDFLKRLLNEHYDYTKDVNPKKYYERIKNLEDAYDLRPLVFYGLISELVGIKSALRKTTRDFVQLIEENSLRGDDLGGNNKAVVEIVDTKGKVERLSALSTIKRFFAFYLESVDLIEASSVLRFTPSTEKIAGSYKLGILTMDGDKMGEWISGKRAPKTAGRLNSKVKDQLPSNYFEFLQNFSLVTPAYQRVVSRTLGNFSKFVPVIIDKYDGLLIYTGGDDVLALLPSNTISDAANDLRKLYSGIGNFEIKKGNKLYVFKNGWCYLRESNNDVPKPIFNMMGEKATMSAGIVVCNKKFNLHLALDYARKAEKQAKTSGRDSFAFRTIRRSGQITDSVLKWDKEGTDILASVKEFFNLIEDIKQDGQEKSKSLKDMILRLEKEFKMEVIDDDKGEKIGGEYLNFIVPYVIDKMKLKKYKDKIVSLLRNLIKESDTNNKIKTLFLLMQNYEYSLREGNDEKENS